jgi:hypothetical protein
MGLFDGVRRLLGVSGAARGDVDGVGGSGVQGVDAPDADWKRVEEAVDDVGMEPERWDGSDLDPPERFTAEAEEFVEFSPATALDFALRSLVHLDDYVDREWSAERFRDLDDTDEVTMDRLVFEGLTIQVGSYVGETVVRSHERAAWTERETGWVVALDGPARTAVADVFAVAEARLRGEASVAASYDALAARAGIEGDRLAPDGEPATAALSTPSDGDGGDGDDGDGDDGDGVPAELETWADRLVAEFPDRGLDGSTASLVRLDELVGSELPSPSALEERTRTELIRAVGCYVGEVLRDGHDGRWVRHDDSWLVDTTLGGERRRVDVFEAAVRVLDGEGSFATAYESATGHPPDADGRLAADGDVPGSEGGTAAHADAPDPAASLSGDWPAYDLDFTPGSLARLDELAAEEFDHLRGVDEVTPALVETATAFGTYVGEVLRRYDGATVVDDDGPTAVLRSPESDTVRVDVVQAAATRLVRGESFATLRSRVVAASRGEEP